MNVYFSQIYIEPGVYIPFSDKLIDKLNQFFGFHSKMIRVKKKFDDSSKLKLRISAKKCIKNVEISEILRSRKYSEINVFLFLPFDIIEKDPSGPKIAVEAVVVSACLVLSKIAENFSDLDLPISPFVEKVAGDPAVFLGPIWEDEAKHKIVRNFKKYQEGLR